MTDKTIYRGEITRRVLRPVDRFDPDRDELEEFQVMSEITARRRAVWIVAPLAVVWSVWLLAVLLMAMSGGLYGSGMILFWALCGVLALFGLWHLLTVPTLARARFALMEIPRRLLGLKHFKRQQMVRQLQRVPVEIEIDTDGGQIQWRLLEGEAEVLEQTPVAVSAASVPALESGSEGNVTLNHRSALELTRDPVSERVALELRDPTTGARLNVDLDDVPLENNEGQNLPSLTRENVELTPAERRDLLAALLPTALAAGAHLHPALARAARTKETTAETQTAPAQHRG